MKRFVIFALLALGSLLAMDVLADTGFGDEVKEWVTEASPGDIGGVVLATGVGAAFLAPGDAGGATEAPGPKLWCVTQEEFNSLEAKYKHLYILDITFDAGERYQFIARRPTKDVIQAMGSKKDEPFHIADMMIKNMIVGGNTEDLEDGVVYSRTIELLTGIAKSGKKLFTKA
ncbi:MAG: hypothetical protein LBJ23_09520 [Tannerella sp.]|jgi:hypothetical protein|nr:hypothetical protein [Tannerella sp.]